MKRCHLPTNSKYLRGEARLMGTAPAVFDHIKTHTDVFLMLHRLLECFRNANLRPMSDELRAFLLVACQGRFARDDASYVDEVCGVAATFLKKLQETRTQSRTDLVLGTSWLCLSILRQEHSV